MSVKIDIQNLPKELRRKGLEERLAEICKKNDIVFMALSLKESKTRKAT